MFAPARCASRFAAAFLLLLPMGATGVAQTNSGGGHTQPYGLGSGIKSPSARVRLQRHWTYIVHGVPAEYRGQTSPLPKTPATIDRGRKQYRDHCAACHRMDGLGGGAAATGLSPSPALLRFLVDRPDAADEYLLWTISEGGTPFGTAMPAFKKVVARDDIWAIIAFMRAGFPAAKQGADPKKQK